MQRYHVLYSEVRTAEHTGQRSSERRREQAVWYNSELIRPLTHSPNRRPAVEAQLVAQIRMLRESTKED